MKWATAKWIRANLAQVPEKWLVRFAITHPSEVRKFANRNGTLLFRCDSILDAIETMGVGSKVSE